MKLSARAHSIEPFHALAIGQVAADMESAGQRVIKLSIGEPDFGAPAAVREAMRTVMDGRPLPYTPALGISELREAIANFYLTRHGVDVDPARIAITSGASAALLLALAATTDVGDEVLMADPSYPCNREMVNAFGGVVRLAPTSPATRYQLSVQALLDTWTDATNAVMIASPSNPTGTTIEPTELAAICQIARERNVWRIVDEIYLDLADDAVDGSKAQTVLTHDPDAIVISSFSKYFGMTGWRLGWAVVPEELVEVIERMSMHYFLCASAPVQFAALAAFSAEALAECESRKVELLERRTLVLAALEGTSLRVHVVPDGAFYIYIDVSATGLDAWTFCERALTEAHVALTPGRDFATETADTHVRLSYAASREDLTEACRRLAEFVATLPETSANDVHP